MSEFKTPILSLKCTFFISIIKYEIFGNFGMSGNFGVPIFIFSSVLTNNKNVFIVILLLFIIYYYRLLTIINTIFFSS